MFRMSFRMSRQFVPCSHAKDEHQDQQALYPMSTSFPFVQILSLQVSELRAAQSGQAEQAADAMLSSFLIKTLFYCRSQSCETHNPVRQSRQLRSLKLKLRNQRSLPETRNSTSRQPYSRTRYVSGGSTGGGVCPYS